MVGKRAGSGLPLLLALAILSVACTGGSHPNPRPIPTSGRAALSGGTLHVGIVGFGNSFDPAVDISDLATYPSIFEIERCCLVRTLLSYAGRDTRHEGGLLHPDLAVRLPQVSADGLVWTFDLKRGINYAPPLQRREIVAGDFVRALERELSPSPPYLKAGPLLGTGAEQYFESAISGAAEYADGTAGTISGLETPDAHTLRIHLTQPSGDLAYRFALPQTAPIPPSPGDSGARFGVATGHAGDFGYFLVASGPYMYEGAGKMNPSLPVASQVPPSGIRADSVTLVRNPSWDPATDDLRKAYVDRIVLTPVDTQGVVQLTADAERSVEARRLDVILGGFPDPSIIRRYNTTPDLKNKVFQTDRDSALYLYINVAVPPFDDVHVRKALNLAFDKDAALRAFEQQRSEFGTVATHIAPDAFEDSLLLNFDPYGPSHTGNLQAAQREMAQSKYDANHDGVCDAAACARITMPVRRAKPERLAVARIAQADLRPLGIDLRLNVQDDDQFFTTQAPSFHVPLTLLEDFQDYPGPELWIEQLVSSHNLFPDCCNFTLVGAPPRYLKRYGYSVGTVPTVDDRIHECQPLVFDRAIDCWARLDQYLMNEVVPAVPLVSVNNPAIVSARVARFSFDQAAYALPQPALDQIALVPAARHETAPSEPTSTPLPSGVPSIPGGTYTVTITQRDARRFGLTDPADIQENTGKVTITLSRGRWRSVLTSEQFVANPVNSGVYYGTGDAATFATEVPPINAITGPTERWTFDGHQLRFQLASCRDLDPCDGLRLMFEAHPWVRVG